MKTRRQSLVSGTAVALLLASLTTSARGANDSFTFASVIPDDVFLCIGATHNPDREFLEAYWNDVFEAAKKSGVGDDFMSLIGSLLDADQMEEVNRIKQRAYDLIDGVDWKQLAGREMVFAERFNAAIQTPGGGVHMGPPDMIALFRGSGDGAAHNFKGLVAILEGFVDEINKASDGKASLSIERSTLHGADVASVNLLAAVDQNVKLPISVALRDDVVLIAMGERILDETLGLLAGKSDAKPIAQDPRFKAAFAKLPAAEDAMVFFDMQAMMTHFRGVADIVLSEVRSADDVLLNAHTNPEAGELSGEAFAAYQKGDYRKGLDALKKAHEIAPDDSAVLYNLACYSALAGDKQEALGWLEKAVDAGFYSPGKIASDADLNSLHGDARYDKALASAADMAAQRSASDVILNSVKAGEAHELCTRAWEAYEQQEHQQGLELVQQAYAIAPQDSRVLYYMACFNALTGDKDTALDYLEKSVDGGFYCPNHIAKDPDLESLHDDACYEQALAAARKNAAAAAGDDARAKVRFAESLVDRLFDAVGILDYVASVETTEGYSTRSETLVALVPDAKKRAIYPVFGKRAQLTDFDRFLPRETVSFSVSGGFAPDEFYKFLEDSLVEGGPFGEKLAAQWAAVQEQVGLNVKEDVFGWIDGDFVSVTLADGAGSVALIKVTDEQAARDKVGAVVELLSTRLTELAAQQPMLAMLAARTSETLDDRLEGFQNLHFMMSPQPVVWGVANGHLIFGSSADAVALCLETAAGKHPGIRENTRVMSEAIVPPGPFTSVTLTDQRNLGNEISEILGAVSMGAGMMGAFIPDPEVRPIITRIAGMLAKLTPVAQKIDFFKSTATCTTFDGMTYRTQMVTHYASPEDRTASVEQ